VIDTDPKWASHSTVGWWFMKYTTDRVKCIICDAPCVEAGYLVCGVHSALWAPLVSDNEIHPPFHYWAYTKRLKHLVDLYFRNVP
jgi:hypothetical protein